MRWLPAAAFGGVVHSAVASAHPLQASLTEMSESTVWRLHLIYDGNPGIRGDSEGSLARTVCRKSLGWAYKVLAPLRT